MPGPFINYEGLYLANGVKITSGDGSPSTSNVGEPGSIYIDRSTGTMHRRRFGAWSSPDLRPARLGSVGVYIGDSIGVASDTSGGGLVDHATRAISPFTFGTLLSQQRVRYLRNLSKGGDTTAMALARWDTEMAPYNFSAAIISLGTNDSASAVPVATFASNMLALIDRCTSKGAGVILCTVPPNNGAADRKLLIATYNQWIRETASLYAIPLVDYYDLLADPANGNYLSGYFSDGTHPNNPGYYAMGQLLAAQINAAAQSAVQLPLPMHESDPTNLAPGGLFSVPTGSGTTLRPTGWSLVSSVHATGVTASFDSADAAINGSWYVLTVSGLNGTDTTFATVSSGIVPGRRYRFVGRVQQTSPVNLSVMARLLFNGSTAAGYSFRALSTIAQEIANGVFFIEAVAPVDASSVQINFQLAGTSGSSGVVKLAQIGLYDLTSLGLV